MRWLAHDADPGDRLFKEIVRCDTCGQAQQEQYLRQLCGLTGEMLGWRLANTDCSADNAAVFDTVRTLSSVPAWLLTLHGPNGRGKTRMLSVLVNEGRAANWTAVYLTTAELLDHLRSAYAPNSPEASFDGLWDKVIHAKILALDELDRWNPTPWAQEKFFELVDQRYRRGDECLTAFATNAEPQTLPAYLHSRIYDRRCVVLRLDGPDWRQI